MIADTIERKLLSNIIILMYVGLFPMVVVFMGLFIKKLEPKI